LSSAGDPTARLCGAEFIARLPGVMIGAEVPEPAREEEEQWTPQN
jgi:two-component system CitB family sensor kinase